MKLPPDITSAEAIAHNKTGEYLDGLDLESSVKFVGKARSALTRVDFAYAQGFATAEWQGAHKAMLVLRERLRQTAV